LATARTRPRANSHAPNAYRAAWKLHADKGSLASG